MNHQRPAMGLILGASLLLLAGHAAAATCQADDGQPGICTYTAEREGVHRFQIDLPQAGAVTIAGQPCGIATGGSGKAAAPGHAFQANCYAYLNSGASYKVTAAAPLTVTVTGEAPRNGEVVLIP